MNLFVVAEEFDNRVAVTPDVVKKFVDLGHKVFIEAGAGVKAGFSNDEYEEMGATISDNSSELKFSDVIFSVNFPKSKLDGQLKSGAILITSRGVEPALCKKKNLTVFSLNKMPRTTRAQYMDVLSSQASLAGYKAVIEAAHILNRALPLMMTTAGTIPAAKVLVIGAGVAGLQAIATAKRLGAVVSAFDVRTSAKEQVESLGAKFIEVASSEEMDGVYAKEVSEDYKKAQERRLREVLPSQDIVITTAQIPGRKAPVIIRTNMIETMKRGAVIVDLATKSGGNCEVTKPDQLVEFHNVKILGFVNILDLIPFDASKLYARNIFSFFELLCEKIKYQSDISKVEDDIIKITCI